MSESSGKDKLPGKGTAQPGENLFSAFSKSFLENLVTSFFDASHDLVFILNKNGTFQYINSVGLSELESSNEEMIGKHFFSIIHPSEKIELSEQLQKLLNTEDLVNFKVTLTSKSGREILYSFSAKALFKEGKIEGMLGVGKNVTKQEKLVRKLKDFEGKYIEVYRLLSIERNRLKQRKSVLEELNRLKSEFVSNISHEMRTPLASIIGFSETISSDSEMPPEMKREFNEIILKEGKRLAKLINYILDISRLESGELEIQRNEINIISVLKTAVSQYMHAAEEKNISITLTLEDEEVLIIGDEERLQQVFGSLISNAVKYTNNGGRVIVLGQNLFKEYEIIISDTGIGIPAKDLPHIFEKFYKVPRPGYEIPGAGLGLVFVKQIIDLHRGLITVESDEKKGSTFIVKLPKKN